MSGEPFPEMPDTAEALEAVSRQAERDRSRRKPLRMALCAAAGALVLMVSMTVLGVISPIRWFTGQSTEDRQQYIVQGHEINVQTVPEAIGDHDAVQNEEDYVREVIMGSADWQPQMTSGSKNLQATTDPDELIAFLGFDPGLPRTVAGVYTSHKFTGLIMDQFIAMSCFYMKGNQPISDPIVQINIHYYFNANDANDVKLVLEQSEEGETISVGEIEVYRYWIYDGYLYLWTQENQLCSFSSTEPTEIAEVFLEDFLRQRNGVPAQAENSDTRSMQPTDPAEAIAFLGFDPGIPQTVSGVYRISRYAIDTLDNCTMVRCNYTKDQSNEDPVAKLTVWYYSDINEAYLSLEQSEEGEMITVGGVEIYRYRNADRYGYTWIRENQVCLLVTREPPEAAEAFLEDFLRQRAGAPVQAQNEGTRSLQTVDSAELISFLGFDPRFPASLNTTYIPTRYNAYIDSQAIKIIAQYGQVDNTITDAPLVSIRMTLFFSVEDARIPFEQDAEGEYVMIGGVSVYRYTNTWTSNYLWLEGQTIVQFLTSMPFDESDPYVEEIIKSRNGT